MNRDVILKVKSKFVGEFKSGYPLIAKEAIINLNDLVEEGEIVRLVDERNQFIGKGYHGKQNKGYGWVLTRKENEQIDQHFFDVKIASALNNRKHFFKDSDTTSFRIFNGEGDGIGGLTIDYFDGYYVKNRLISKPFIKKNDSIQKVNISMKMILLKVKEDSFQSSSKKTG
jgi:23S rRNA (cytosine1962-C5)-methyltransferase